MKFVSYNPFWNLSGFTPSIARVTRRLSEEEQCGDTFPVHMDIIKEKDDFKIVYELPGMEKDKIRVMVENDILTISGEKIRKSEKDDEVIRSERYYGSFTRSFRLPESIEKSGISADYKNGLLEIFLPIKPEEKPKQIDVKIS